MAQHTSWYTHMVWNCYMVKQQPCVHYNELCRSRVKPLVSTTKHDMKNYYYLSQQEIFIATIT